MRKQLALALAFAMAVPQAVMARPADVSATRERSVYGEPAAVANVKEISELDAQISNKIVALNTLRRQLSAARLRSWIPIGLSLAGLAALIGASRAAIVAKPETVMQSITAFLQKQGVKVVGYPAAVGTGLLAATVGLKEASRLALEIDEVTQELKEQQARLNQLYQAASVAEAQ